MCPFETESLMGKDTFCELWGQSTCITIEGMSTVYIQVRYVPLLPYT